MSFFAPSTEQFEAFNNEDDGAPVTMLNLLAYRDAADYSSHPDEAPCSGKEAYGRYARAVVPIIESVGGRIVFAGAAGTTVVGPESERWDDLLLVEYPNRRALIDMLESERYQAIAHHRTAALTDSRLVPVRAGQPAFEI